MKRALLLLLTLISLDAAYASCPDRKEPQKGKAEVPDKKGKEQEPNLDGVVEVSFKIDNLGKVQILNINSTSPQLSDYVIKKLGKIQLEEGTTQLGKVIKYRFVFKKQA